jgi:hypothetical protein
MFSLQYGMNYYLQQGAKEESNIFTNDNEDYQTYKQKAFPFSDENISNLVT